MRRATSVAVIGLATLLLTGCGSTAGPTASGSPATSPTGQASSPAATPTPSATHPTGRNPTMTDAEALERITDPQTGEKWFGTAKTIAAPGWAAESQILSQEGVHWYELGTRGSNTIVGVASSAEIDLIFERGPNGAHRQIDYPSPRQPATTPKFPAEEFGVAHDRVTYYDSFALPQQLELPSGDPVELGSTTSYGVDPAGEFLLGHRGETASSGGRISSFEILRYDSPGTFAWSEFYDVAAPAGVSVVNWYYLLRTPWGTEIPLGYDPFGTLADVTWDAAYPMAAPDPAREDSGYLTDLNDSGCGPWDHDHVTVVRGLPDSAWVAAGTSKRGKKVYLPATNNPLLAVMYKLYTKHLVADAQGPTPQPLSQQEFVAHRGLVAYKTPATGNWVVFLNSALSARAWC